jgi:hypothetical protein
MDPNEFVDIQPWPVAELVGHLVTQVALGKRGLIERDDAADPFERETDRFELDAWAKLELTSWLGDEDTRILEAPIGNLSIDDIDRCAGSILVASTIAWTVRGVKDQSIPLPSDGDLEQRALAWAPGPWTPLRQAIGMARARSDEDLAAERERWEVLYWRTTLFEDPVMAEEDRHALQELVEELRAAKSPDVGKNDLVLADGTPITNLDRNALDDLQRETEIRLRTLNWVCGFGESPASAPLFIDE